MTSRREFFRALSKTPSSAAASEDNSTPYSNDPSLAENDGLLLYVSHRAMACDFEIRFPLCSDERYTTLALEALELLEPLEEQLSFFRPASEISRINLLAAEKPVKVETGLFQLLTLAKELWRETDGAFDLTATPLWQTWGFARRAGSVPSEEEIAKARSLVGFDFVELDPRRQTIFLTRPGVKLNLGAIGKGYALDRCAAKLIEGGMENFLIHGAQSSIIAHGWDNADEPTSQSRTADPSGKSPPTASHYWRINIPHPYLNRKKPLGKIRLRNQALGTSSSRFQSFRHKGKLYGHIIDPRSGQPANGLLLATVIAPSAALADALSTAFFVLGLEKSLDYCHAHPEIGAVLLAPSKQGNKCEIHLANLTDRDFV